MCRRKTLAMQEIEQSCISHNLDVNELLGKSRLLLKTYQSIHWTAIGLKEIDADDSYCFSTEEMECALDYLNSFPYPIHNDSLPRPTGKEKNRCRAG